MATRNAIERLTRRIDALATRRWGRFTLDSLTDDAWLKIERIAGERAGLGTPTPRCEQFSDDDLIRVLVESGVLTAADFRGNTNGNANGD